MPLHLTFCENFTVIEHFRGIIAEISFSPSRREARENRYSNVTN